MDRSNSYTYPFPAAGNSRYASSHASSSAFSASANPNEDWTKISDLAERRRIQNRIAQRNYRKKLKRRLEDLERRAASSSASPEQSHRELEITVSDESDTVRPPPQFRRVSRNTGQHIERRLSPEPLSNDDRASLFGHPGTRQSSASPPPSFTYSTYPPADTSYYSSYPQQTQYSTMAASYPGYSYGNQYLQSLPPTLPSMVSSNGFKRDAFFAEDDLLNPFSMTYASMAGIDVPSTQGFGDDNAQVNPTNFFYP